MNPIPESPKMAAIEMDDVKVGERDISQISARDFLAILDREGLGATSLSVLPEKKKVELLLEPEWNKPTRVVDIVRVLKVEKKKAELELPIDVGARINPALQAAMLAGYARASGGGATGYPGPDDDDRKFPPQVEWRKATLDHRFDLVAVQVAQLQVAVQELSARLERVLGR